MNYQKRTKLTDWDHWLWRFVINPLWSVYNIRTFVTVLSSMVEFVFCFCVCVYYIIVYVYACILLCIYIYFCACVSMSVLHELYILFYIWMSCAVIHEHFYYQIYYTVLLSLLQYNLIYCYCM
jgi:hypothetical protein